MSRENVEIIEALLAGTSTMDKHALLAALPAIVEQLATPDIEWVEDPQRADARVSRGHAAVLESWTRWLDEWDEWGYELEDLIDCGDDVLVTARERGRGATSGASVDARNYMAFTIREGKIARYREFYDEQAARKAVGLEG